ncbi:hypothetical protein KUTeg_012923 [Tegillarca granosa]|uniref:Uncharacterized protein n=1 Tax=Tegillarca granosa TaxID=220873 RepID=A0ABQ9ES59_TEGGR|nr:hypothetical protein KUTeg_012923 [Tegillarca granosa]
MYIKNGYGYCCSLRKNIEAFVSLSQDGKRAIDVFIKFRNEVGIPVTNPYIFARLNAVSPWNLKLKAVFYCNIHVLQLLIAVEKGDVLTYKGTSLSDISVAVDCVQRL